MLLRMLYDHSKTPALYFMQDSSLRFISKSNKLQPRGMQRADCLLLSRRAIQIFFNFVSSCFKRKPFFFFFIKFYYRFVISTKNVFHLCPEIKKTFFLIS